MAKGKYEYTLFHEINVLIFLEDCEQNFQQQVKGT